MHLVFHNKGFSHLSGMKPAGFADVGLENPFWRLCWLSLEPPRAGKRNHCVCHGVGCRGWVGRSRGCHTAMGDAVIRTCFPWKQRRGRGRKLPWSSLASPWKWWWSTPTQHQHGGSHPPSGGCPPFPLTHGVLQIPAVVSDRGFCWKQFLCLLWLTGSRAQASVKWKKQLARGRKDCVALLQFPTIGSPSQS